MKTQETQSFKHNQPLIDRLISLVLLDIDAIHAYDQAINNIESLTVKNQFLQFKYDHERHVQNLTSSLHQLGAQAPEYRREFKGYSFSKFKSPESSKDLEEILHIMKENEQYTNMTYDGVLSYEIPDELRTLIKNNRDDERRHLKYIRSCIDSRIWEQKEAA
ncbi:ferritin-like domain-containing protein [bacterium]|nr:ferritin-like domain-containing protein [bacterium]